ncbi:MAG: CHASE2 domain-containing protein [bacterium]|nr:CHASE2 domain-containing protein [bacterium]
MKRFVAFWFGICCAIFLLIALYTDVPYVSSFLHKTELQTIDYRMKYTPQPEISPAIKIVMVNDPSNLSEKLARFIHLVASADSGQYKPKNIGLNYRFDAGIHQELVSAASMINNVYYGYSFVFDSQQTQNSPVNNGIMPFRLELTDIGEDSFEKVFEAQRVQLPAPNYLTGARGIGFVNTLPDIDGVFRRIPLFLKYQENWYGSLALLLTMDFLGIESVDLTFYPGQYVEMSTDDSGLIKVPVNRYGEMLIDFAYEPEQGGIAPFEVLSMEDILDDPARAGRQLASLKDAIVLIGSKEAPQPIPLTPSYPLLGILANFINNILTERFIKELPQEFQIGIIILAGMISGLLLAGHRLWVKLLLTIFLAMLYLLIAYGVFFQFTLLLPALPPLLTIGLTFVFTGLFVRHKKQFVEDLHLHTQPLAKEKKRKGKSAPDELEEIEDTLLDVRDELDRKSLRLKSKVEELRILQEEVESNHYDYSRQVASLQKEIRAREIEIQGFLSKEEELRRQMENLTTTAPDVLQVRGDTEHTRRVFAKHGFITQNEQILFTLMRVEKFSPKTVTVLIQGEVGTGKTLLASLIKEMSPRCNHPVLQVICDGDMDMLEDDLFGHRKGAFPGADEHRAGFFRKVDGGTLILDELENLSLEIQTRLVQVARGKAVRPLGEDGSYPTDVRILATTTRNLKELVSQGEFRNDLYQYLTVFPLFLPPLRDRKEDIPALVAYLLRKYSHAHSKVVERASENALHLLIQHQWPGNITELEKIIERAIIEVPAGEKELSERYISFEEADLTGGINDPGMLNYLIALMDDEQELPAYQPLREKVLSEIQRLYCIRLLRLHHGDVKNAAIDIGLKVETFKKMLVELMLDPENFQY